MSLILPDPSRRGRASRRKGCACGCGTEIPEISKRGTPQRFVWGHNTAKNPLDLISHEDRGYQTPCWIWQGGKTGDGRYGRAKYDGRMRPAHHIFLLQDGVEIPEGYEPDHLCRVTLCVNPAHLEVVTRKENVRRSSAKLTEADVIYLRAIHDELLRSAPPLRDGKPRRRVPNGVAIRERLGRDFGVTADQIKHIWGGRAWR